MTHKMIRYRSVLSLLLLTCGLSGAACGGSRTVEKTLSSFRNPSSVEKWRVRQNASIEFSQWPDGRKGGCAKLSFTKYQEGTQEWPAAILNLTPYLHPWSELSKITFEIYADTPNLLSIGIRRGSVRGGGNLAVRAGLHTYEIPRERIGDVINGKCTELHFFKTKPPRDWVCYIGDIKLVFSNHFERKLNRLQSQFVKLKTDGFQNLSPANQARANAKLKECRSAGRKLLALSKQQIESPDEKSLAMLEQFERTLESLKAWSQMNEFLSTRNSDGIAWGWISGLEKVHQKDQVFQIAPQKQHQIEAAQNEAEPAQLILLANKAVKDVEVRVCGDLKGKNGVVLPGGNVSVAPVGYVFCPKPPYKVTRTGYWPDPILDYARKIDLSQEIWQSFWVDVKVPSRQPAGVYSGEIQVSANGVKSFKAPFSVKVYGFSVPDGVAVTMGGTMGASDWGQKSPQEREAYKRKVMQLLLDHRLNPDSIYRSKPLSVEEAKYLLDRGAGTFCILHIISGGAERDVEGYTKDILERLDRCVPEYRKAGILDKGYIYGFDEIMGTRFEKMKTLLAAVKKRYPSIPIVTTAKDTSFGIETGIDDVVDVWVPSTAPYCLFLENVKLARQRGRKVWWYLSCSPWPPYPNWFIENPAMAPRVLMGLMTHKYKPDGFLYYRFANGVTYHKTKDGKWRWKKINTYMKGAPLTDVPGNSFQDFNGDGSVLYFGKDKPLASIRLKNIRDGYDDYIYLKKLEKALADVQKGSVNMSEQWQKEAANILDVSPELVKGPYMYTTNPDDLLSIRRRMAHLLEEFYRSAE